MKAERGSRYEHPARGTSVLRRVSLDLRTAVVLQTVVRRRVRARRVPKQDQAESRASGVTIDLARLAAWGARPGWPTTELTHSRLMSTCLRLFSNGTIPICEASSRRLGPRPTWTALGRSVVLDRDERAVPTQDRVWHRTGAPPETEQAGCSWQEIGRAIYDGNLFNAARLAERIPKECVAGNDSRIRTLGVLWLALEDAEALRRTFNLASQEPRASETVRRQLSTGLALLQKKNKPAADVLEPGSQSEPARRSVSVERKGTHTSAG